MTRKVATYLFLIFGLLMIINCASSKKESTLPGAGSASEELDESFDPLSLDDEDIVFKEPPPVPVDETPLYLPVEDSVNFETAVAENKQIDGFRIQLLSTKDLENATRAKAIAMEQFIDVRVKFYLEFDSPYYKVRLGDFHNREEAEEIREVVRSRGYPKAWIVKSKIWSNPEFPVLEDSTEVDTPELY
jgi:hypothetical protein